MVLMAVLVVLLLACGKSPSSQTNEQPATSPGTGASSSPTLATRPTAKPGEKPATTAANTVPAGDHIVIRLGSTISSKRNNPGDAFSGTVAEPVTVNGQTLIPEGSAATGTVADAKALGRFKGGAVLRIVLSSVTVNGKNYKVETAAVSHSLKGKGKRSAVAIGGGAGLGAIIGGIAGGGKGAAIGAAAGAGAGTAGAAFTGNKDIVLPAESAVSFKLLQPLEIR
jgi:hypothetical protein